MDPGQDVGRGAGRGGVVLRRPVSVLAAALFGASTATAEQKYELPGGAQLFDRYKYEFWAALEERRQYDALLRRLPENVPEVVAAWWLTSEVYNGGFEQYFQNTYGGMIDEAIRGLELTGQVNYAAAARLAKEEFAGEVPFDWKERNAAVKAIRAKNAQCWSEAEALYSSGGNDEWARYDRQADEFARAILGK